MAKIVFNDKDYKRIQKEIASWYRVVVPIPRIKKLLRENPDIAADYVVNGPDTVVRENFLGAFSKSLIGMNWPIGSTPAKDSEKFFKKLIKKLNELKIKHGMGD